MRITAPITALRKLGLGLAITHRFVGLQGLDAESPTPKGCLRRGKNYAKYNCRDPSQLQGKLAWKEVMSGLDESWQPGFGEIFTWFASDKNGRVAVFVNNCFGRLPKVLLHTPNVESELDRLSEYMWEESPDYSVYPPRMGGQTVLDLYSACVFRSSTSRGEVEEYVRMSSLPELELSDFNLPSAKGFYVYHGVEGSRPGEDYPVGYEGITSMGDYFRYLLPTVAASLEEIPASLRHIVVKSHVLDFESDRVLDSDLIDEYFPLFCV